MAGPNVAAAEISTHHPFYTGKNGNQQVVESFTISLGSQLREGGRTLRIAGTHTPDALYDTKANVGNGCNLSGPIEVELSNLNPARELADYKVNLDPTGENINNCARCFGAEGCPLGRALLGFASTDRVFVLRRDVF